MIGGRSQHVTFNSKTSDTKKGPCPYSCYAAGGSPFPQKSTPPETIPKTPQINRAFQGGSPSDNETSGLNRHDQNSSQNTSIVFRFSSLLRPTMPSLIAKTYNTQSRNEQWSANAAAIKTRRDISSDPAVLMRTSSGSNGTSPLDVDNSKIDEYECRTELLEEPRCPFVATTESKKDDKELPVIDGTEFPEYYKAGHPNLVETCCSLLPLSASSTTAFTTTAMTEGMLGNRSSLNSPLNSTDGEKTRENIAVSSETTRSLLVRESQNRAVGFEPRSSWHKHPTKYVLHQEYACRMADLACVQHDLRQCCAEKMNSHGSLKNEPQLPPDRLELDSVSSREHVLATSSDVVILDSTHNSDRASDNRPKRTVRLLEVESKSVDTPASQNDHQSGFEQGTNQSCNSTRGDINSRTDSIVRLSSDSSSSYDPMISFETSEEPNWGSRKSSDEQCTEGWEGDPELPLHLVIPESSPVRRSKSMASRRSIPVDNWVPEARELIRQAWILRVQQDGELAHKWVNPMELRVFRAICRECWTLPYNHIKSFLRLLFGGNPSAKHKDRTHGEAYMRMNGMAFFWTQMLVRKSVSLNPLSYYEQYTRGKNLMNYEKMLSYQVIKTVGDGVFGQVVCAIETNVLTGKMTRYVAVKISKEGVEFKVPAIIESLMLNELMITLGKDHGVSTFLCESYDTFIYGRRVCLVLPFFSMSLHAILQARRFWGLSTSTIAHVAAQLSIALKNLSCFGAIHCDLKPENVLVVNSHSSLGAVTALPEYPLPMGVLLDAYEETLEEKSTDIEEKSTDGGPTAERQTQSTIPHPSSWSSKDIKEFDKPLHILHRMRSSLPVRLCDLGCVSFSGYNIGVYVQSRYYRAPEVLLGLPYHGGVDVWSMACLLAEMRLGFPLFPGVSSHDQIRRIVNFCGLPPPEMIEGNVGGQMFFVQDSRMWRLRTKDEYEALTGVPEANAPTDTPMFTMDDLLRHSDDLRHRVSTYFGENASHRHYAKFNRRDASRRGFLSLKLNMDLRLSFKDFVEKCLVIDPRKRMSLDDVLHHDFVQYGLETQAVVDAVAALRAKKEHADEARKHNRVLQETIRKMKCRFSQQKQNFLQFESKYLCLYPLLDEILKEMESSEQILDKVNGSVQETKEKIARYRDRSLRQAKEERRASIGCVREIPTCETVIFKLHGSDLRRQSEPYNPSVTNKTLDFIKLYDPLMRGLENRLLFGTGYPPAREKLQDPPSRTTKVYEEFEDRKVDYPYWNPKIVGLVHKQLTEMFMNIKLQK